MTFVYSYALASDLTVCVYLTTVYKKMEEGLELYGGWYMQGSELQGSLGMYNIMHGGRRYNIWSGQVLCRPSLDSGLATGGT